MNKFFAFLVVGIALFFFTSCAALTPAKWSDTDMPMIKKGQSVDSIMAKFGKPSSYFTDSKGNQILEYRKPAKGRDVENTWVALVSLGQSSGKDSAYVDYLKITAKNGKVVKHEYQENVELWRLQNPTMQ